MRRAAELDARARAALFSQLALAERGGVPVTQTLLVMGKTARAPLQRRIERLRSYVSAGQPLPRSGERCGLFLPWESRAIEAAAKAGRAVDVYARLSRHYTDRAHFYSRLKGRLLLPAAVLVVAMLVKPLPALFRGEIDAAGYLLLTALPLTVLFISLAVLSFAWRQLSASGADNTLARALLYAPLAGGLLRRQQQRDYLANLALLLEAGVALLQALPVAAQSISHPDLRSRFAGAVTMIERGTSVSEALARCTALDESGERLLAGGEHAGRLPETLLYHVRQIDERQQARLAAILEWSPRFVYATVIALFVF